MKNILLKLKYVLLFIFLASCGSNDDNDDDCTKTIIIPQIYIVNGQSYTSERTQEVPCDFPEPEDPEVIDPPMLENFTYEVLNFSFTPDTGNNTSRLEFEIKLNNPNDFIANGVPILTTDANGLQTSGSYSNNALIPCYQIDANSNCILTFNQESSLDLGIVNSIELIDVEYFITD